MMTSCKHMPCNQPPSDHRRVLVKLSYRESQRSVYYNQVEDDVMFETEYRPTTSVTECVDLNPFDLNCRTCRDNFFAFSYKIFKPNHKLRDNFCREQVSVVFKLLKKARQEHERQVRAVYSAGEQDVKNVITFEQVLNMKHTKLYHRRSDADVAEWATSLSAELATIFDRFNGVEVVENHQVKDKCSICLRGDDLTGGNYRSHVRLPCHHVFHGHCIATWLKKKNSCPLCHLNLSVSKKPRLK